MNLDQVHSHRNSPSTLAKIQHCGQPSRCSCSKQMGNVKRTEKAFGKAQKQAVLYCIATTTSLAKFHSYGVYELYIAEDEIRSWSPIYLHLPFEPVVDVRHLTSVLVGIDVNSDLKWPIPSVSLQQSIHIDSTSLRLCLVALSCTSGW